MKRRKARRLVRNIVGWFTGIDFKEVGKKAGSLAMIITATSTILIMAWMWQQESRMNRGYLPQKYIAIESPTDGYVIREDLFEGKKFEVVGNNVDLYIPRCGRFKVNNTWSKEASAGEKQDRCSSLESVHLRGIRYFTISEVKEIDVVLTSSEYFEIFYSPKELPPWAGITNAIYWAFVGLVVFGLNLIFEFGFEITFVAGVIYKGIRWVIGKVKKKEGALIT